MSYLLYRSISVALVASLLCNQAVCQDQEKARDLPLDRGDSVKQAQTPQQKEDKDAIQRELHLRARYIAEAMADSKDTEDKLEASHMKADFAALLCQTGEPSTALRILRNSFDELVAEALAIKRSGSDNTDASEISDQALQIAETATRCDPASRAWFVDRLRRLQSEDSAKKDDPDSRMETPVVPDKLWGSKPSLRREIAANFFAVAAHGKLDQEKLEEAQKLLEQSLNYCLVTAFITGLARLRAPQQSVIADLYTLAARKVQALPSGSEVSALSFGLKPLFGITLNQSDFAPARAEANRIAAEGYLDAVTSLAVGPNSNLAAQSPDTLRMIKSALPLYSLFRMTMAPQIDVWCAESAKRLPPDERAAVETVPFVTASPAVQAANIEEIAAKSTDAIQRDQAYASLASMRIQRKKFEAALEFASKISDLTLKREVLDDVYFFKLSLRVNTTSDLVTLFQVYQEIEAISSVTLRVRAYTLFGRAVSKDRPNLGSESLQNAASLALKLDSSPTKSHLLLGIASAYGDFDLVRMRDVLMDAVKSINSNKKQPVSRWGRAIVETTTVNFDRTWSFPRIVLDDPGQYKKPYDLSAFGRLVRADFEGARMLADQISERSLRASALYEICAGILLHPRTDISGQGAKASHSGRQD